MYHTLPRFPFFCIAILLLCSPSLANDKDYYIESPSYGTQRETDPPRYVRTLSKTGIEQFKHLNWLDAGMDFRYRYEYRNNDLRRAYSTIDNPNLWRTRAYVGVHDILDPLRVTVEFEDARRYNSDFARDDRDVNEFEFIQAYGELYFKDGFGLGRPISTRIGRMAFEALDRRLIARNEWRNTTNNFQGIRTIIGKNKNDWEFDAFALQPLERKLYDPDEPNERQWFYGGIVTWRRWSDLITLQPFYLGLHQDGNGMLPDRVIHSPGLRGYGYIGKTGFDYDLQAIYQFGRNGSQSHQAFASVTELGYRFDHEWKPRLSANYGYGSGDENPNDSSNERFERFFGFARPWSNNDYFQWENIHAPKLRLELQPNARLRIDTGYSAYWLASDTDRWNNAGLRDNTGNSGDFIGQEYDIRVRYKLTPRVDLNIGYANFQPGAFTSNRGRPDASNFIYTEFTVKLFE